MVSAYEKRRLENIKKNQELLASLGFGLDRPTLEPIEKRHKKPSAPRKRKIEHESPLSEEEEEVQGAETKAPRVQLSDTAPESAVRRSSRNAGKVVDYNKEIIKGSPVPVAYSSGVKNAENAGPLGSEAGSKRIHDPKQYGHIPGIEVGTWWESRQGCSADAVHAPWVGGISGGAQGAHSVVISGGYEDDVDDGYLFTYTGSGGRALKGTKSAPKNLRTAPQSSDQNFEHTFNRMLKKSCETKKPIRVVRGFKSQSKYAPSEGYRYDGLYIVEKAWIEPGLKEYLVCKYAFKRLPGQPPLPVRATDIDETSEEDNVKEDETIENEDNN
ncbi:hypothetical protein BDN70DRAFT_876367 [Pholiota conissans]|uniref:YDG domain-containing protein n=1 Tax=Pholiota conissans TaxID=109636 RepID=A0A9P6CV73_9AGAR|nr:hypothetical protein BDN70DRAFT_876367 [Pholiota conissans]